VHFETPLHSWEVSIVGYRSNSYVVDHLCTVDEISTLWNFFPLKHPSEACNIQMAIELPV
jgi:hypothetical protein